MTFRDDNDALRQRIADLEKAIEEPAIESPPAARFEIARGPRRMFWWVVSSVVFDESGVPTDFGLATFLYMVCMGICALVGLIWIGYAVAVPCALVVMVVLPFLRIWIRLAMALDVEESREAWARRFQ